MTPIVEKTINDPFVMMANPSVVVANMGFKMMFNTLAMSGPKEFIMIFLGHSTHSQKYFVYLFAVFHLSRPYSQSYFLCLSMRRAIDLH